MSPWTYIGFAALFFFIGFAFILPSQGVNNGLKVAPRWARITFISFEIVAVVFLVLPFFIYC